jgi:hypothetical protein
VRSLDGRRRVRHLKYLDHVLAARHGPRKRVKMLTAMIDETDSYSTARQDHRPARFVRVSREIISDRVDGYGAPSRTASEGPHRCTEVLAGAAADRRTTVVIAGWSTQSELA